MKLRSTLLLLSSALLLLPWLGYHYLQDMQRFLLRGQESAQQLTAQAVATLLQQRAGLLQVTPARSSEASLYAWPTDQYMLLDGYDDDWDPRIQALPFGPVAGADGEPLAMSLRLAQRGETLWLLVRVTDRQRVYRHPSVEALDRSDQLRLALRYHGEVQRLVVAVEAAGAAPPQRVERRWQQGQAGPPLPLEAHWQETSSGYQVELQLPVALLAEDARLWLEVVDLDDPEQGATATLASGSLQGRAVHLHAPELQRLVAGLRQPGRHIRVLDRQGVVRAVSNLHSATPGLQQRAAESVALALQGQSVTARYPVEQQERILVAEPVRADGEVVGVVLVEVATRDILDLQRSTLLKTAALTAAVFALILLGLLWFGARLTSRIHRLAGATRDSLDPRGRVLRGELPRQLRGRDELGRLGEDISTLLTRQQHYTGYLERMPRTLRHELSNPLNTIATSLQMLRDGPLAEAEARYLDSAERGVVRLSQILASLAEAASLEEALQAERLTRLDLAALLRDYQRDHRAQYPAHPLTLELPPAAAWIDGNALRLEQALDKLVDNAADFAPAGSAIRLALQPAGGHWQLRVINQGPPLDAAQQSTLFESLVTSRGGHAGAQPHLGIGLYVVRLILTASGGQVAARNRADGVEFVLTLPAAP